MALIMLKHPWLTKAWFGHDFGTKAFSNLHHRNGQTVRLDPIKDLPCRFNR